MAHEVNLGGTIYISSKRAAEITGYAQDYIGQLARSGQIEARRISGMWYVLEESVCKHKEGRDDPSEPQKAEEPVAPVPEVIEHTADSGIDFDGKEYLSATRASRMTGYSHDYVTQLARAEKIPSRQIGSRWYVEREGIIQHKKEKDALLAAVQAESVGLVRPGQEMPVSPPAQRSDFSTMQSHFTYEEDRSELLPRIHTKEISESEVVHNNTSPYFSNQNQNDFVTREEDENIPEETTNQIRIRVIPHERRTEPAVTLNKSIAEYLSAPKAVMFFIVFVGVIGSGFGAFMYFDHMPKSMTTLTVVENTSVARAGTFEMPSNIRAVAEKVFSKELVYRRRI